MNLVKMLACALIPIMMGLASVNLIAEQPAKTKHDNENSDCKLVLGTVERLLLPELDAQITARVDTGATLSSISAHNIQIYEENNLVFANFNMATDSGLKAVKVPIQKFIQVKQQAKPKPATRPVILLEIELGSITGAFEFSLSDRAHLSSKALIGRNILSKGLVVDISQQLLMSDKNSPKRMCNSG
tara:strand:- start:1134 stop:1694 length:561 start_codon:yes stop_codon:yes gene_type:complete